MTADHDTNEPGSIARQAHRRLREATAAQHHALGAHSVPASMGRGDYVRYLRKNAPCLFIEPALAAAGVHRILPDWGARQRGLALERDLAALGVSWRRHALTIAGDAGTLLGWSYVLEGSRFGARLILRVVEATADADVRSATRFLRHGEGVDLWTGFTRALARIDNDPVAIANACNGARAAFQCFLDAAQSR